jgi:GT2 family glycosyltransferase
MPDIPRISVLVPLYRGRGTIKACLESLIAQKDVDLEILLLDNGCPESTGESAGHFPAQQNSVKWELLEEPGNIGFAAGMNELYARSTCPLVLFLNQDVILAPDHLAILARALNGHPRWGGATGTLFRQDSRDKRIIDTTGHVIFRDRIVRNRGAGHAPGPDGRPEYPEGEVFGVSAACALFRREALEAAREEEGPFDPDFFAYFEDIDLDYRMRRAGWELGYVPDAVGWHALGGSKGRREFAVRLRAYGNRRRILWKHETCGSLLPDLLPILAQDTFASIRALVTDPVVWLLGPWILFLDIPRLMLRRKRLDLKFGTDRKWIRKWLRPEEERWKGRGRK